MEALNAYATALEEKLEHLAAPVKPHVPMLGRFLIVATFLEDTVRILSQWNAQLAYLEHYQKIPFGFTHFFLVANVALMALGSTGAILRRFVVISVASLTTVLVMQLLGYGLIWRPEYLFRALSVFGGLLMLLADGLAKKRDLFAGLPQMNEADRQAYVQLAGRVLLVLLFISFTVAGEMSVFRLTMIIIGFAVSVLVVLGFKAKFSALFLVMVLSVGNVLLNNWWSLHHNNPGR
jgi:uncharacterized membrane protein YphA (DoxX/SURF4 family)